MNPDTQGAIDPTPTWSVGELHEAINGLLDHVFGGEVWVEGELRNVKRSSRQHVYFDLVDPGAPNDVNRPMLSVTLFDSDRQEVNRHIVANGDRMRMVDGVRVRIRGRLATYPVRSTLQLRMTWIDPTYTLGVMGQERDRVLAALAADGLLDRNGALALVEPPLHVGIVTSIGSAAHADALDELRRSGLGFRVTVIDARTQGVDAEMSLVRALHVAESLALDVVALVRGGGARTDLAAFDSERLARTIAALSIPVITGIGHEIDRTVADDVAHTAHKTPTAAAAALVVRSQAARDELHDTWLVVGSAAAGRILRSTQAIDRTGRAVAHATDRHLRRDLQRITNLVGRVAVAAPRCPADAGVTVRTAADSVTTAARRTLSDAARRVDVDAARARAHDPALAMARGWTITRSGDGRLIRSASQVGPGERISTVTADGELTSIVDAEPTRPDLDQEHR